MKRMVEDFDHSQGIVKQKQSKCEFKILLTSNAKLLDLEL